MVLVGACVPRPAATSILPGICYELAGVTRLSTQIDRARREAKIAGDGPGAGAVRHLDGTALMDRIWQSAGRSRRPRSRALERHLLPPARRRTPAADRGGGRGDQPMPVAPLNERAAEIHNQLLADINEDAWPALGRPYRWMKPTSAIAVVQLKRCSEVAALDENDWRGGSPATRGSRVRGAHLMLRVTGSHGLLNRKKKAAAPDK